MERAVGANARAIAVGGRDQLRRIACPSAEHVVHRASQIHVAHYGGLPRLVPALAMGHIGNEPRERLVGGRKVRMPAKRMGHRTAAAVFNARCQPKRAVFQRVGEPQREVERVAVAKPLAATCADQRYAGCVDILYAESGIPHQTVERHTVDRAVQLVPVLHGPPRKRKQHWVAARQHRALRKPRLAQMQHLDAVKDQPAQHTAVVRVDVSGQRLFPKFNPIHSLSPNRTSS